MLQVLASDDSRQMVFSKLTAALEAFKKRNSANPGESSRRALAHYRLLDRFTRQLIAIRDELRVQMPASIHLRWDSERKLLSIAFRAHGGSLIFSSDGVVVLDAAIPPFAEHVIRAFQRAYLDSRPQESVLKFR